MEKKGEILNQLAIIADLLEKSNLQSSFTTVTFDLEEKEFNEMFKTIAKKNRVSTDNLDNVFMLKIGEIEYVFNMSNA